MQLLRSIILLSVSPCSATLQECQMKQMPSFADVSAGYLLWCRCTAELHLYWMTSILVSGTYRWDNSSVVANVLNESVSIVNQNTVISSNIGDLLAVWRRRWRRKTTTWRVSSPSRRCRHRRRINTVCRRNYMNFRQRNSAWTSCWMSYSHSRLNEKYTLLVSSVAYLLVNSLMPPVAVWVQL